MIFLISMVGHVITWLLSQTASMHTCTMQFLPTQHLGLIFIHPNEVELEGIADDDLCKVELLHVQQRFVPN